jgi:hypothetical protein
MPIGTKGWFYVFSFFDFEFRVAVQEWADEKSAYLRQFFFLILIELSKLVQCFR